MDYRLDKPRYVETVDGFDIYFTPLVEYEDPADFFPEEEDQKMVQDLREGYLAWFTAKVSAHKAGVELAAECLGACAYDEWEDFYTTYHGEYFTEMELVVVQNAKDKINELMGD